MIPNNTFPHSQPQPQHQAQNIPSMVDGAGNPIDPKHYAQPQYQNNNTATQPPVSELDKQFNELFGDYFAANSFAPNQSVPIQPTQQQPVTPIQPAAPIQQQFVPNQSTPMQQQPAPIQSVPNQSVPVPMQFAPQQPVPMQSAPIQQSTPTGQQAPLDVQNINSSMSSLVDKHNQITMERLKDHVVKATNVPSSSVNLVSDYLNKSVNVQSGTLVDENNIAKAYNEAIFKLRSLSPALFDNNAHSSVPAFGANQGNSNVPVNGMIPVAGQGAAMMHNYLRTSADNMTSDDFRNMFNQTLRM